MNLITAVFMPFRDLQEGFEVIMYNSNPETVSTDYDVSDILIFDPITEQDVLFVVEELQPDGVTSVWRSGTNQTGKVSS